MTSFTGKILRVDLNAGTAEAVAVPPEVYEAVLAGKGLEAWYLYNNIPAGADPLGPDNILAFAAGALCGTGAFLTGRWTVACKSPLTGGWGDANCGGIFAPAIKQCGYDAIFISGIAEKPVYLFSDGKTVEVRDASAYWGLDAVEAEKALHADLDPVCRKKPCVACIGPAGEKLSLISGICNEGGRIAARSGVGAVMGSKKLKAVVLAGSLPMRCNDPEKVKELSRELGRKLLKMTLPSGLGVLIGMGGRIMGHLPSIPMDGAMTAYMFREWGTQANTPLAITSGDGPIKNWGGTPKDARRMDAVFNPEQINKIETAKYHCYSCPLGCGGKLKIRGRKYVEFDETHKPEYETIEAFGPLLMNWSLDSIFQLNELLNRAGMDVISAGNTVAWAIECYERGILTWEQTDGLALNWGNTEAILTLVRNMVERKGFGGAIADGVKRASERFGGKEYAMHIGGQEPGMHDARNDPQLGIHFVAEPAPGKHTVGMSLEYGAMSLCDICSWAPPATLHPKSRDLEDSETMAYISKAN
ncbi:MAG: aldehyde ferredoxin oxidoreductase, partial [Oscillospiraceae bacterium]|nr:aldehyde ferredoxin oxidoreductase [Oscillospiraceae bacterium]